MRARHVLVPLVLVLAALGAGELGARAFRGKLAWRPLPPFGDGSEQRAWLERTERELADGTPARGYSTFDAALGWTTLPGHVSPDGTIHVDARGLRATHAGDARAPGRTRRVIACGESFTFGEEVADADTWAAQLEALAGDVVVENYGVGGYGTDQALLRVAREAQGPAEVLLVGLMLENIGRNVNRYRPLWYPSAQPAAKPRYVLGATGLALVSQPFASREEFLAAVRSGAVIARLAEHEYWSDRYVPAWLEGSTLARMLASRGAYRARDLELLWSDVEGEPFRTTLALLESARPLAAGLGARLVVLVFPTRADLAGAVARGSYYWSTLHDAMRARGIEFLDLADTLTAEARSAGVDSLYGASHFSPRGNALVARAIAERLAQD